MKLARKPAFLIEYKFSATDFATVEGVVRNFSCPVEISIRDCPPEQTTPIWDIEMPMQEIHGKYILDIISLEQLFEIRQVPFKDFHLNLEQYIVGRELILAIDISDYVTNQESGSAPLTSLTKMATYKRLLKSRNLTVINLVGIIIHNPG
jgi:hypothetical protein